MCESEGDSLKFTQEILLETIELAARRPQPSQVGKSAGLSIM